MSVAVTAEEIKKAGVEELLRRLSSDREGLTSAEAEKRLRQYGPNDIPEKKVSPLVKFAGYFWGPIPWMIEAAVAISAAIRRWDDFSVILALLLINAGVRFWQEHKADNAIELLKRKLALRTRVLRDGKWAELPAPALVPGDIVLVRLGDIVPADLKLLEGDYLLADQAALTGESMPVEKHVADVAYAGTIARQGEMVAVVASTGQDTYFGKTAGLVEEAKTQSHFQKAVVKIGDYLIALAMALVTVIFLVALYRDESVAQTLQFALVLTVAAIPAALPAVLSVTMALGAMALAGKEAIVSRLLSIEEMAGMDVLCSDKTGTITKNEITVGEVRPMEGFTKDEVLLYGALASRQEAGDPIDEAILGRISAAPEEAAAFGRYKTAAYRPFDPVSKRTEATVEDGHGRRFKVSKGAPQVILSLTEDRGAAGDKVGEVVEAFASRGYRALGVAGTDEAGKWRYVGLVALYDPPREDSGETIVTAEKMGVAVKMVTGDHVAIAQEIARQVGMGTAIVPAASLLGRSDSEARRVIEGADGFAQVFPEHKFHIVELLQSGGHIVGMTGDGVNDAPALKKADAGIAVSGATDAAKSAAGIVLTKPGLSVIIDAIRESRRIFERMTSYAIYRIAETIRVLFFISASIVIFRFYPVTALMIVLLAILNDLPIMTIAFDNVRVSGRPEKWHMHTVLGIATGLGLMGIIETFGILYVGLKVFNLSHEVLQSFIYLKLSVAGHLTVFMARTRGPFWSVRPAKPLFLAVMATQLVATLITVYGVLLPAMGWRPAFFVWGYCGVFLFIIDFLKVRLYGVLEHEGIRFHR